MNDKVEKKEVPFITPEAAEMMWNKLEMVCPQLGNDMKPKFRLRNSDECPMDIKGDCNECTFFMGALSDEDGTFHAMGVYNGFCDTKKNKAGSVGRKMGGSKFKNKNSFR